MKVYDYRCPACGHREERFVSVDGMDAQYHAPCPKAVNSRKMILMARLPPATPTTWHFADRRK